MQFQVPQFLDVEDKIIGPFTIKQFLYLAGGLGMGYLAFRFIPWIGIILGLAFAAFGATLAFYKFNNKPFIFILESAFSYIKSTRFYVWKKKEKAAEAELNLNNFKPTKRETGLSAKSPVSSKLSDLSWSMNVTTKEDEDQKRMDALGI
ncbi:MAG: hypothetical protein A3C93_04270 [Candidatus Lloydbacteria bacterium RIFCSPHIGHO2_02_FULL_54_17]|uniref:PrgI family protein n=1 Tax=Candidatus Lloydbacteria bacterium RIFCSPHIGHO2_02_FULL_54_17 TaxID=1798664 RepID=A0A1G2DC38_9BACT|nr:MAG: hypothetical protein A2762_03070 [Candidatus Lloydbacteria bacterium RIFCSPHIGHO2_01_FULL_54_11]OGZ11103.1 MAG: hypothetical protein A3C93_04270 [Candidatus Lloydbacteria bacterium RIFCSPHIGHO2_02_FULL_54_17]OGZ13023.1 MAG: hypothetical protein A2948_06145 [Candidatus Lloydbacteria bacterium RIFCSPLOWO2_01_FULL_54_18]OGZ17074.1 MAG: hypothetical protein A3H76_01870 [Candidatus Lloydbacteria bacterium RIFCSPLOWO2_02_FULL_54_12]